jgi:hypothetical protein
MSENLLAVFKGPHSHFACVSITEYRTAPVTEHILSNDRYVLTLAFPAGFQNISLTDLMFGKPFEHSRTADDLRDKITTGCTSALHLIKQCVDRSTWVFRTIRITLRQ